ncbi:MAG: hypothetical protein Q6K59_00325 [Gloeomargarita sp. GMQP_bins_25]
MARSQQVRRLRLQRGVLAWLLSCYYRSRQNSGFVLPTATLLIIVAFLVMMGLLARTANRLILVSGQRERVMIEGPTAESLDRARAKLEYLFTQERGLPTDPSEQNYEDALGHRRRRSDGTVEARPGNDVYTLPDEVRCGAQTGNCLDAPAAFTPDNLAPTWAYRVDLNGNGRTDDPSDGIAVYSIIGRVIRGSNSAVPVLNPDGTPNNSYTHLTDRRARAANFLVNNAPAQAERADAFCAGAQGSVDERGRFSSGSSATELKNFQIYAVTIPNRSDPQLTANAMVLQQDRQFVGANKFGAWFRYDLEIFPGPQFNWNGAMHTEGSLILTSGAGFGSFLISAPNSCYYLPPANSEISVRGLFMSGSNRDNNNNPGNNTFIHLQPAGRTPPTHQMRVVATGAHQTPSGPGDPTNPATFTSPDAVQDRFQPVDISMDPLFLLTDNLPVPRRREGGSTSYDTYKDNNWGGGLAQRITIDKCEVPPYVDDTYRADNRLGPKSSYARGSCSGAARWQGRAGDLITTTVLTEDPNIQHSLEQLTRNVTSPEEPDEYGLDGYWERRALGQGMKVIVGQRLELGNVSVWGGWRTYGTREGQNNYRQSDWQSWTANPSKRGSIINENRDDDRNAYFGSGTNQQSRQIFGLFFRPNVNISVVGREPIWSPGAADPLYPPLFLNLITSSAGDYNWGNMPPSNQLSTNRLNWQLHRRTQRDNLAAVQATAVYHHTNPGPSLNESLPLLCLSSTIHPGTEASYFNSITFGDPVSPADPTSALGLTRYPRWNANFVRPPQTQALFPPADFFTGRGTANVEYGRAGTPDRPPFEVGDFRPQTALMQALENLAYFAGDPNGAYPPLQQPRGRTQVHPDPIMTMWGNFSNLRRTIEAINSGTAYAELSPADQANLHTAGCTLGILANNLSHYLNFPFYVSTLNRSINLSLQPHSRIEKPFTPPGDPNNPLDPRKYQEADPVDPVSGLRRVDLQRLAYELWRLQDGVHREHEGNYEIGQGVLGNIPTACSTPTRDLNCYNIPAEFYIAALAQIRDNTRFGNFSRDPNSRYQYWNRLVYLARMLNMRLQIVRDRTYGFNEYLPGQWLGGIKTVERNSGDGNDPLTNVRHPNNERLAYRLQTEEQETIVDLPCDLSLADINYFGYKFEGLERNNSDHKGIEQEMIALARLCPTQPKYPSLYYLFPGDLNSDGVVDNQDAHGHDGTAGDGIGLRNSDKPSPYNQPSGSPQNRNERFSEPYVLSDYIANVNRMAVYRAFQATGGLTNLGTPSIEGIRLEARTRFDQWQLPNEPLVTGQLANHNNLYQRETDLIISDESGPGQGARLSAYRLGLAEKALYDGRQLQTARVMDFDLDLLRRVDRGPRGSNDAWLAVGVPPTPTTPARAGGIIYAFREDAVREDAILRPANSTWTTYLTQWQTNYADGPGLDFRMNYDPRNPSDPPLAPNGISGKPVDYYADPDRRVHGFRLVNGNDISRVGVPPERNIYGLTFVTDNPLYIMTQFARGQSGFNLHMNNAGVLIEEFNTLLPFPYNFNQFYVNRTNRNLAFAKADQDTWRPAEILADAITLITHNFCDGYLEHGIRNVTDIDGQFGNECTTGGPSFRNTPAITTNPLPSRDRWARENPYDLGSPIIVGSNGTHRRMENSTQISIGVDDYQPLRNRAAVPTRGTDYAVNAVIISGLVPSRRNQAYGGLHNFPRFLESGSALRIQGSLIQLNFSNYATAPFDFDSFERQQVPIAEEHIPYYGPPSRFWGYDPALQYAPAGPVAQRFKILSNARNEYGLELTAQDPYICQLRRFVTPGLTCPLSLP